MSNDTTTTFQTDAPPEVIHYEQAAWMQSIADKYGAMYLMLGRVTNPGFINTLAVTPVHGKGQTLFFCQTHQEAYGLHGVCTGCRLQEREEPKG